MLSKFPLQIVLVACTSLLIKAGGSWTTLALTERRVAEVDAGVELSVLAVGAVDAGVRLIILAVRVVDAGVRLIILAVMDA